MMTEPLYLRIARNLRGGILSGEYKPRDMLPSEHELAVSYQTSRVTVRKSLDVLENEGLVRPWHGKGYFVLPPKYTTFTLHFADSMAESRFQEVNILRPPKEVAEILQLKKGQMSIVTRRVLERVVEIETLVERVEALDRIAEPVTHERTRQQSYPTGGEPIPEVGPVGRGRARLQAKHRGLRGLGNGQGLS
jgi:DNA-binding GntR family transcriptional regulator